MTFISFFSIYTVWPFYEALARRLIEGKFYKYFFSNELDFFKLFFVGFILYLFSF
jgi:hypothetical protein